MFPIGASYFKQSGFITEKKKAVRVLIVILKTDNLRNARAKLDSILGTLQYCFFFSFLHTTTTTKELN